MSSLSETKGPELLSKCSVTYHKTLSIALYIAMGDQKNVEEIPVDKFFSQELPFPP